MTSRPGDFLPKDVQDLAMRTGHICAYPNCRILTSVPKRSGTGASNHGEGAHMVGVGSRSPRPPEDHTFTEAQIRCARTNGIWLCRIHAHEIDTDPISYPLHDLKRWQREAEERAAQEGLVGRRLGVVSDPVLVAERADHFVQTVERVLPRGRFSFGFEIRDDQVKAMHGTWQWFYPFNLRHLQHGIEPNLVLAQEKVIADLGALIAFLSDGTAFWFDPDRRTYHAVDNRQDIRDAADAKIAVLFQDLQNIHRTYVRGEGYYGAR